jgi:hypothetical protein
MTIEHAMRHYIENREKGTVNCASMCLAAILPFEPSPRSLDAARHNIGSIDKIALLVIHELLNSGIVPEEIYLASNEQPSRMLRRIYREVTFEKPHLTFQGALIRTKEQYVKESGWVSGHVIAVTKLHRNWKATVVDTAPKTISNPRVPFEKKVPLDTLDRRTATDSSEERAIAFTGLSLKKAKYSTSLLNRIERLQTSYDEYVQVYADLTLKARSQEHPIIEVHKRKGRTKRRHRLDRRMHDVE